MSIETKNLLPSEEKPWQKFYCPGNSVPTDCNVYDYIHANFRGDAKAPALHYYGTTVTYGDFFADIEKAADCFAALGIGVGDHVAFLTINLPESLSAFYALNKIGAIPVLIEPRMSAERIRYFVEMVHAKAMLLLDIAYPKVDAIIRELKLEHVIVQSPSDSLPLVKRIARNLTAKVPNIPYSDKIISSKDFYKLYGKVKAVKAPYVPGSVCAISQTGGTTGSPKGVMLTHKGLNTVAMNFDSIGLVKPKDVYRYLVIMPLFTSYGIACGIHAPLSLGKYAILVPDFTPDRFPALVKKYKPHGTIAVPTFFEKWIDAPELKDADLSKLILTISGGDYMNHDLEDRFNKFLADHGSPYPVAQGYGLSETSSATAFSFGEANRRGSVGVPLYTSSLGIFKPGTTQELGYNEEGEICIAGDTLMKGYFDNKEETDNVMWLHPDGKVWVHTGDLATMDEDGFLFFKGRTKFVIPRFDGHKLFPSQIQNVIARLETVEECAVISVKDRDHSQGMLPLVVVKPAEGCRDSEKTLRKEILDYCSTALEERGQPCGVVFMQEDLPLTPIGKVDITKLTQMFGDYEYRNEQ